ncbi:MAG: hypothetical protein KGM96_12320 [Acidobacteriota bacterium]|jgi:hypothetical protein|nr:hypothetical protein [Acidobacteriota bacterium]
MEIQLLEVREVNNAVEFALTVPKIVGDIYVLCPRDGAKDARVKVLETRCELSGLLTEREWFLCRIDQIRASLVSIAQTFFRLRDAGAVGPWIDLRGNDPQADLLVNA